MSVKQISVFLENRPGQLQKMTSVFARENVDMRALSVAETKDFGIARLIVDDVYEAVNVLKDNHFIAKMTEVLVVSVPDEPGGLDNLLKIFAEQNVNVEYMYAFFGTGDDNQAYMIIRTTDTKNAEKRLKASKIKLLTQEEIANL